MSESEFRDWNNNKRAGLGGTSSELIADIVYSERNSGIEHLVIITDGSVESNSIDDSDKKIKQYNIHFKFVSTYIIGSGGDRSVGAPYCRGDPSVTYLYKSENNPEKLASLSHAQIKLFQDFENISSYNEFISKYDNLREVLEAQMYGKNADSNLVSKINKVKNNVLRGSLNSQQKTNFDEKFKILYSICNGGLRSGKLNFSAY